MTASEDQTQLDHGAPAPLETDLRSGTELGPFMVGDVIGRGGMGIVYRAEHSVMGRPVALKLLSPHLASVSSFRERFLRECRMAADLWHPSIVPIFDAGELDGTLFIAMQLIDGEDLSTLLEPGALDADRGLRLLGQVAAALDYAHERGLVHRDVKPENVMVAGETAFVTDLGLTKRVDSKTVLTAKGEFVGSADYMAPEQIRGDALDPAADRYSFACLAYHVLAGSPPFGRASMMETLGAQLRDPAPRISVRNNALPDALDAVFTKALAKTPQERFATCAAMIAAIRNDLGSTGEDHAEDGKQGD